MVKLTFTIGKDKSKYVIRKATFDFLFDGSINDLSITVCEIFNVEMYWTLTLTFNGSRPNVNMQIERPHITFY